MERIVFAEGWQKVFADSGYKSFNCFFKYRGGERINEKGRKNVQSLTLDGSGRRRTVFIKLFRYPHF